MSSTSGASIRWTRPSRTAMGKARLEAFSDGVIAVIITIMVLELKAPHGTDLAALAPLAPALLTYVLSFVSRDRKSTRLNSSHGYISYAVFCLKKKSAVNLFCCWSKWSHSLVSTIDNYTLDFYA